MLAEPLSHPARPEQARDAVLIERLVERFHRKHLAELPALIELAWKVERVHRGHDACPLGAAEHLLLMFEDLEAHQQKEEAVLFPMILAGRSERLAQALRRIGEEHAEHLKQLRELRRVMRDFEPPPDACGSWRRLYEGCRAFHDDLREHVRIEDALFARALGSR